MKVDKVDKSKRIGKIILDNQEEADLILESMQKLIKKQEKNVQVEQGDVVEQRKLDRYKKAKNTMEFVSLDNKKNKNKNKDKEKGFWSETNAAAAAEEIVGDDQGTEVSYNDMYDIVNALNENIYSYERDGTYKSENAEKYNKLVELLEKSQNEKGLFERVPPKPRRFGRLRK